MTFPVEILSFFVFFIRMALTITFGLSFLGKVRSFSTFEKTIVDFEILPQGLNRMSAWVFGASELITVFCLFLGDQLLVFGFLLAMILLAIFSIALVSVLIKNLRVACHCFGDSGHPVSIYDIWRNAGLILCALLGWTLLTIDIPLTVLSLAEKGLIALLAIAFVIVLIHLSDIALLFVRN